MHSVTGVSANDAGEDSDPGNSQPDHRLGCDLPPQLHPAGRLRVPVQAAPGGTRRGDRLRHAGQPARRPRPGPQAQRDCSSAPRSPACSWPVRRFRDGGDDAQPGARRPVADRRRDLAREPTGTAPPTPAGGGGARTSATTTCPSAAGHATSAPRRGATWPSCRRPTSSTTSAASSACRSRSSRPPRRHRRPGSRRAAARCGGVSRRRRRRVASERTRRLHGESGRSWSSPSSSMSTFSLKKQSSPAIRPTSASGVL